MKPSSDFHHQATLKICGHLQIGDALLAILQFLREHMPIDKMFLQFADTSLRSFHTLAIATPEKGAEVDLIVPLSPEAMGELEKYGEEFRRRQTAFAWLFDNNPWEQLASVREYFSFHKTKPTSLMILALSLEPKMIGGGSVFLITEGAAKLEQSHADLLASLKEPFAIALSNALRHREILKLKDILADDNRYLTRELQRISGDYIVGADFGLRSVMQQVSQVAPTESPVLLSGETGVGKDVIATAIHRASPRRDGPFIPVNCGAIPESLIDSELFGHEKGAFTGALGQKRGKFERADKGTILLDEIGEMPLEAQVRLLRVLQNREIERIGGTERIPLDIRVIAATNKDLTAQIKTGRFREDLYFRLNVFPITVPPLRERTGDIPALVQYLIDKKSRELKVPLAMRLADGAIDSLVAYDWPGNVRELENCIERAMILSRDGVLQFPDLGPSRESSQKAPEIGRDQPLDLDSVQKMHIERVLDKAKGKIHGPDGAGALLGMNPNTLRSKMRKLKIPLPKSGKKK